MSTPIVRRRKKAIEVDTVQWLGNNEADVQAFTGGASTFYALDDEDRENSDDPEATATVYDRLHSTWVLVYTGQHIVRGVKGEFYPIAEDVLAETYEPCPMPDPSGPGVARRKLIAALSEDSYGGIATLADVDHAEQLVDAHKAEVLAEADLLPKADVVAWLVKKEREIRAAGKRHHIAQADAVTVLASKVERGAIRPDNQRMLPPDFFEPGRTYTEPDGSTDWKFRCDAITTHPEDGQRTALGWRHFQGEWTECAYREDEFEIHLIADALGTQEGSK